jgi:hypothetical protein
MPPVVKHLRHKPSAWVRKRKRCQAQVGEATQLWRAHCGKDMQCELGANFIVDGMYLCKRHAGDKLLAELVDGEEWYE